MNIRIVRMAPGQIPEVKEISDTLKSLQAEVGGYLESIC